MIDPPRWSRDQLTDGLQKAQIIFRLERMEEPLEAYLQAFAHYEQSVKTLLQTSENLSALDQHLNKILTDAELLKAFRYLAGPPISEDDLKVLADAALSSSRLQQDSGMAGRVLNVVRLGLDKRRFPWVGESRMAEAHEMYAAVLAT